MIGEKLPPAFYQRKDVTKIARELLGKALFTKVGGLMTGGIIVETEAYSRTERGCHAYLNKVTPRNSVMFLPGGVSYVYLCYGIHYLFNVVTNIANVADAVLVRAIEPIEGVEEMALRRKKPPESLHLTSGPGKLSEALGINRTFNGKSLCDSEIWIQDVGYTVSKKDVVAGPRIGIDYAGEDAKLPWRFHVKGNRWVSKM